MISRTSRARRSGPASLLALVTAAVGLLLATNLAVPAALAADQTPADWTTSWGAAPSNLSNLGDCNPCTVRNTVHVSLGGAQVRLTLSNALGTAPLTVDRTNLSLPSAYNAATSITGTRVPVTFGGSPNVTIPAGQSVVSDPVAFTVRADTDVQVSSYFSGNAQLTYHSFGTRTASYVWRGSDQSQQDSPGAATGAYTSTYVAAALDVRPAAGEPAPAGSVVVFGDSITDGVGATGNADERWADSLASRLSTLAPELRLGVVNEAISGNRVLLDGSGPSAISRFQRDVVGRAGVRSVIILEGINDLRQFAEPISASTTQQLIDGLKSLADTARAAGISPIGATILPFKGRGEYTAGREAVRQQVNSWIRSTSAFDSYVDFDAVIDDPANPGAMRPDYDSGDHLHPGPLGNAAMADEIDLAVLGAYERPGSVQLYAPTTIVRGLITHVVARVTAARDTDRATVRFSLPSGWTHPAGTSTTIDLGPLAAGRSAVASLQVSARTPGGLSDGHVMASASLDGLVTSTSQQIRTTSPSSTPDVTAPSASITLSPVASPASGWYTGPVTVDVASVDDQPGFRYDELQVDAAGWVAHIDPVVLTDGRHTVEARSTDAVGNVSDVVTRQVNIDTTAPVAAATFASGTRLLTLTATDATSGVASIAYRVANGAWTTYTSPVATGDAAVTISYRATDKAGNVSATASTTIAAKPAPAASSLKAMLTPSAKARYGDRRSVSVILGGTNGATAAGTVSVLEGTRTLVTATLSKGRATLALPKNLKVGTHRLTVRYAGSSAAAASSTAVTLTVAKATARVSASAPRTSTSKRGKVTAKVTSAGAVKGTAKVTVTLGKKKVVSKKATVTKAGKVSLALPRLPHAGRYKVTVTFTGTSSAAKATGRTTLTVRR